MRLQKPKRRKPRRKLEQSRRKSDVLRLASRLTSEAGDRLPINLRPLRERRAIRAVKFRPLLTDGTLVVLNHGFYILVRCTAGSEESLNALFERDETGTELPHEIVRQSRFTI